MLFYSYLSLGNNKLIMSKNYREDFSEHEIKGFKAQKNERKARDLNVSEEEEGITCSKCRRFLTYTYLARNSKCYNCDSFVSLGD
jgi:LSD1 subclass zinc finger protein